jgi:hypothetical protein
MSDAAVSSPLGGAPPRPARDSFWRAVAGLVWQFPFALLFAALASAVLVIVVGLLIAFMQYQQRLLKVQPLLTAAQVVNYVATSNRLQERFSQLDNLSAEITKLGPEYNNTLNEIRFRVDRICALFRDDDNTLKGCRDYLNSIPFAGTTKSSQVADAAGAAAQRDSWWSRMFPGARREPEIEMSPELSKGIRGRFIEILGGADRQIAGAPLGNAVALYTWDLEEIAKKNVKFWLSLSGPYTSKHEQYRSTCENVIELANVLAAYRQVDVNTCTRYLAEPRPGLFQPADLNSPQPLKDAARVASVRTGAGPALTTGQNEPGVAPSAEPAPDPSLLPGSAAPGLQSKPAEFSGVLSGPGQALAPDNRQIMFELVTNYSFYDRLLGSKLQGLLISPSDFLALALVCFGGVLGALLRIVFFSYVSGRDPNIRNIFIGPILGLICALVVYILFRAGFIVITDRGPSAETATLSPFVIAIISMSAGLLSERAIELFQRTGGTWLGSAEASQASRWAVRLQEELDKRKMEIGTLAQRLDVSKDKLVDWAAEKDMVPIDKQREISLVLDIPVRQLFTDLPPAGRTA